MCELIYNSWTNSSMVKIISQSGYCDSDLTRLERAKTVNIGVLFYAYKRSFTVEYNYIDVRNQNLKSSAYGFTRL
jgi:hypothetical protein